MLISPANRTEQRLYWESIHAGVNITKIKNFLLSFALKFLLPNQGSLTFSRPEVFCKKDVHRNFLKLTGNQLSWRAFVKICKSETCSFIKKRFQHRRFLEDFVRFFRTPIYIWLPYVMQKKSVLTNPAKFTAKFMRTAATGISENRPCLTDCKFIDFLQNWM